MPTFLFGGDASLFIDNSGGTPVDVSPYVVSISWSEDVTLLDKSTLGVNSVVNQPGLANGQVSVSFLADATIIAQMASLKQLTTTSTLTLGPGGTTTGLPRSISEARLANMNQGIGVNDLVKLDVTFQLDGDVTHNAF